MSLLSLSSGELRPMFTITVRPDLRDNYQGH